VKGASAFRPSGGEETQKQQLPPTHPSEEVPALRFLSRLRDQTPSVFRFRMSSPHVMAAMPRLKPCLQALDGRSLQGPSIHPPRHDPDQPHRPGGTRAFPCPHHLLALRLRSPGLKALAGTLPVGAGAGAILSRHRLRGGRPRVVSQRWARYHPHLPTGWMRNGLLLKLQPVAKSPCGKEPRPLAQIRPGGLTIAQSPSLQIARTLL
jgi:hypothetical protein